MDIKNKKVVLKIMPNGPISIQGHVNLKDKFKDTGTSYPQVNLCRCGLSKNMPYCDNNHFDNFDDSGDFDMRPAVATKQEPVSNLTIICVSEKFPASKFRTNYLQRLKTMILKRLIDHSVESFPPVFPGNRTQFLHDP